MPELVTLPAITKFGVVRLRLAQPGPRSAETVQATAQRLDLLTLTQTSEPSPYIAVMSTPDCKAQALLEKFGNSMGQFGTGSAATTLTAPGDIPTSKVSSL